MRVRLGIKFVTYTTVLTLFIAVFFSLLLITHERTLLTEQLQKRGVSIASGIASNCQYGILTKDRVILDSFIKTASLEDDVRYVGICDERGKALAHTYSQRLGKAILAADSYKEAMTAELLPDGLTYEITIPVERGFIEEVIAPGGLPAITGVIGFVRVGITMHNINQIVAMLGRRIYQVTAAIIAISIFISIFFSNHIVRPIERLLTIINRITEGDLTQRAEVAADDEIGELASAFNQMTKELKISRDEIEEYSHTLEGKVKERTEELEKANEELKRMQAQLVQSAKMTAIGQLGAGVAHELNNPIGGILGYAQFMLEKMKKSEFKPEDFQTCKKYLEHIQRESQRCKTIVDNLLSFSRKSAEVKPIDVKEIMDRTISIVGHQLILQNIKVLTQYSPDVAQVEGNANQLQQVFTNIMLNAQQAMPKGGELRIAVANIVDEKSLKPKQVEIKFTDTGCGIAKEDLPKIFDPFFTTRMEWKGTGLGLSISYEIVHTHKGEITVESELGKGTTFTVTLPPLGTAPKTWDFT